MAEAEQLAGGKLALDYPAEAVARLRIDNQAKRGALDHEILDGLARALPRLDRGAELRCLVITGSGPTFSAGYDIGDLTDETFEREAEALVAHPFHAAVEALAAHPVPVVAAINGHCLGGGLELAVTCDLRVAAAGAKLGMPPAKLGLVYSHTGLARFIDAIGVPRTKELFLTGRNLSAARAAEIGLVHEVAPDAELADRALELASEVAAGAPLSARGNKRIIDALAGFPRLAPEQERELIELRRACFGTEDFREGIRAFAEKRVPEWKGR